MPAAFGALIGTGTPATAPNSTYAITTTGSVPAGGHLVVGGTWWEATSATADANGTALTADIIATPNADNYHAGLWSFPFPGGLASGVTVTLTFSVAAYAESIMALYLTGIAPTSWLDTSAAATVASFGNWGAAVTTTTANTLLIGHGWVDFGLGTSTPSASYTEAADFQNVPGSNTISTVHRAVSAAGSYTPGGQFTVDQRTYAVAAAYREDSTPPWPPVDAAPAPPLRVTRSNVRFG